MDKRVIRYVFKDTKLNLVMYFISLIVFLIGAYVLKYFNAITEISGIEIMGVLIITIANSFKIIFDFLFLKGNNFKRKAIGISYLIYGLSLSLTNGMVINLINYIFKGNTILETFLGSNNLYMKFIYVFGVTFSLMMFIWLFVLMVYRTNNDKVLSFISFIIGLIIFEIIRKAILIISFNWNNIILGIIVLSVVLSMIFYWRVKRFKVIGGAFEC